MLSVNQEVEAHPSFPAISTMMLECVIEHFPIRGHFTISRGSATEASVIVVTVTSGQARGRGEAVPSSRYNESVDSVLCTIQGIKPLIEQRPDRTYLQELLPPGAARNAIDCALWDLQAKYTGVTVLSRIFPALDPVKRGLVTTAYTVSLDSPVEMAMVAAREAARPLLKIKLKGGKSEDEARLRAVRTAAPNASLILDPNESWEAADLISMFPICVELGIKLIEQPLSASADEALRDIVHLIPICADESVHDWRDLAQLRDRYDFVNVKLDKTGGLTEALHTANEAKALGFGIMIGSRVGSSLAMAPAMLLTEHAEFVDLDGPLLLQEDREDKLDIEGSQIKFPQSTLWG